MDVIIPSNAVMLPTFAAGGATAAARLGGILAGAGGASAGASSATADGFDGIVEDDAGDDDMDVDRGLSPTQALGAVPWRRLRSVAEMLVRCMPGFQWDPNSLSVIIVGDLADKIALWEQERLDAEEERAMAQARLAQQQQQHANRHCKMSSQDMDVDEIEYYESRVVEDDGAEDVEEDDDDDPEDSEPVRELKVRIFIESCLLWKLTTMGLGSTAVLAQLDVNVTAWRSLTSSTDTCTDATCSKTCHAVPTITQGPSWIHRPCRGHEYSPLLSICCGNSRG
jgi:hypothetical protein